MKQNLKKLFAMLLTVSMVAGMLSTASFAEGETTDFEEQDPYVYQVKGSGTYKQARNKYDKLGYLDAEGKVCYTNDPKISAGLQPYMVELPDRWEDEVSDYVFNFRWMDEAGDPIEDYSFRPSGWRGTEITTGLFRLTDTRDANNTFAAYCCDFLMSCECESLYKLLNLEDSTYFNKDAAKHIRGIFEYGYWLDWSDAELEAAAKDANEWLSAYQENPDEFGWSTDAYLPMDAEDPVNLIDLKTWSRDDAISATQLAIWAFANTESDGTWIDFRQDAEYGTAIDEMPNNVEAFRKYLLHQQADKLSRGDIVISDKYFVQSSAVFTTNNADGVTYDVTLQFKLQGDIKEEDELVVTASLGNEIKTVDLKNATPNEDDFYCVEFVNVSKEDIDAGEILLSLVGNQYVDGVYFFEAKPANGSDERESSQNLVGKFEGMTPVSAEASFTFVLGEEEITLVKYNGEATPSEKATDENTVEVSGKFYPALSGVTFDLYAEKGSNEFCIKSGLVTDAQGKITVTGLPEGYEYFFKEVSGLPGYECDPDVKHIITGNDGTVTVENCYDLADLTLSKTVEGVPTDEHFTFTVTLDLSTARLKNAASLIAPTFEARWSGIGNNCFLPGEVEGDAPTALHQSEITFAQVGEILTANVMLKDGESLTIKGIPTGTSYTVTEADNAYTPVGGATQRGTVGEDVEELSFRNVKYNYSNDNVEILAKKTVDGEVPGEQTFTFDLHEWDGEEWIYVGSARNDANGDVTFKLTYTSPDEGIYRIQEINEGGKYVYDNSTFYAKVKVTHDEGDLEADVNYYEKFENGQVKGAAHVEPPTFDNKAYKDGSLYLSGVKYLDNELSEKAFTFELYDVTDGRSKIDTAQSGAGGVFQFDEIRFTEPGTYQYEVKEKAASGYTCDTTVYTVTVAVTREDNGDMTVGAPVITIPNPEPAPEDGSQYQAAIPVNGLEFYNTTKRNNRHEPDDAQWQLKGTKTLDGQKAGGFTFQMVDEKGKTATVTSKDDGSITFPKQTFDQKGDYTYTITEVAGEDEGIVYDAAVYTVTVTVEKVKGDYEVTGVAIAEDGAAVEAVSFENTTKTTEIPEDPTPTGDKPGGGKENGKDNDEEIFEEDVPLADAPATGDISALWLALSAVSGTGLVGTTFLGRKKREDD